MLTPAPDERRPKDHQSYYSSPCGEHECLYQSAYHTNQAKTSHKNYWQLLDEKSEPISISNYNISATTVLSCCHGLICVKRPHMHTPTQNISTRSLRLLQLTLLTTSRIQFFLNTIFILKSCVSNHTLQVYVGSVEIFWSTKEKKTYFNLFKTSGDMAC